MECTIREWKMEDAAGLAEMGYYVGESYWGMGIGTSAVS